MSARFILPRARSLFLWVQPPSLAGLRAQHYQHATPNTGGNAAQRKIDSRAAGSGIRASCIIRHELPVARYDRREGCYCYFPPDVRPRKGFGVVYRLTYYQATLNTEITHV